VLAQSTGHTWSLLEILPSLTVHRDSKIKLPFIEFLFSFFIDTRIFIIHDSLIYFAYKAGLFVFKFYYQEFPKEANVPLPFIP